MPHKLQQKNQFRIIAGRWRGRKLQFADGTDARPTGDRVRETLFNWLSPLLEGATCLDLFAGSGALGLEALSRGAKQVAFVDSNRLLTKSLEHNLTLLQCSLGQVYCKNAATWVADCEQSFDVVFLDPPFQAHQLPKLCKLLHDNNIVNAGGRCYIEMSVDQPSFELPSGWQLLHDKRAGRVRFQLIEVIQSS